MQLSSNLIGRFAALSLQMIVDLVDQHTSLSMSSILKNDSVVNAALLAEQGFSVFLSSDPCRLGSRPQRGAGQEERGAGNPATRGCLHLSPLASRAKPCEHDEHGKALIG